MKPTLLGFLATLAHVAGYQVFTALPYMPADAAKQIRLWENIARKSEGLNLNASDARAKPRNTPQSWEATVGAYATAAENGMVAVPWTIWNYGQGLQ